ncbi:phage protein Gp27 family protein [Leisingera methylohalidivorans]|uniref:DUF3486 family protein n=1 Tax=Leisingera methylohalidivorans DSM 14336 TaxID=999552 RepID=V9VWC5_9RHOB|nr:phage protein Gp27 family protein [Leisingera methylohalidivorans]AHD01182.1 hypothetical protein METH_11280 [Leisingera methylohalidivorans DSM 14336]
MPRPRKINMMPGEVRDWLNETLRDSGWSGYEKIADDLNAKLQEEGIELQIGKSAVHEYGQEYREFVKYQEQASQWAESWMTEAGLEEEAQRHNVLFQMLTTLAFKFMQQEMAKENGEIDPRELHFIGKMMKDVMASSGIREKLMDDERGRIARMAREEAQAEMAGRLDEAVSEAGLSPERAENIRNRVLGLRT